MIRCASGFVREFVDKASLIYGFALAVFHDFTVHGIVVASVRGE